ncbi:hypothetical protein NHX12_014430 [Muraenolepis orangiensis]|uniref:Reverse transcriptase domain-containing protein n=1 Tax=Muraenolepis orangiensis TaxID=630683 RepID=A0A9Q0DC83_9TELE|nr:hypothetical protein NHX12_014430 [Muraenolepis orangiensis]
MPEETRATPRQKDKGVNAKVVCQYSCVAVSVCSGVRGLISLNSSHTFYLEPIGGQSSVHWLLSAQDPPLGGGTCGHAHETGRPGPLSKLLLRPPQHQRVKRDGWGTTKYMELYIVADNALYTQQNKEYHKTKLRIMEIAHFVDKVCKHGRCQNALFSELETCIARCHDHGRNPGIDTSVQKGCISGMPGCLEHTGVVTQLIREARENKGNLSVLWLDLENAFCSIPHKLVQFTLTKHHVPSRCRDLIADYYSNFRMRVSSEARTSSWHKVEIGIITGCTISVTLFSLAMNMLTKSAEPECRGPRTNSGQRQPPIRAFMDDLTVMTESVPGCRWILKGLEELVEWVRMRFKPAKSRSMVLRKGKVVDKFRFNIADTAIPSISEKPVKSLGKVFDCSLRDTTSIQSTCTELDGWLKSVDKSGLPGKFKAWVYQHGILPRILWPLLVYAVPISTVETLERRASVEKEKNGLNPAFHQLAPLWLDRSTQLTDTTRSLCRSHSQDTPPSPPRGPSPRNPARAPVANVSPVREAPFREALAREAPPSEAPPGPRPAACWS